MIVRTSRAADQDIIDIYVRGAAEFGIDQAEGYHSGLMALFSLLADSPGIARLRAELTPPVRGHPYRGASGGVSQK